MAGAGVGIGKGIGKRMFCNGKVRRRKPGYAPGR